MIYDCFTFFNELDVLELRLMELDAVVDRFVIAEAPVTFAGRPKPLWFADHRERFAPWLDRIVHVVVDDMPATHDPWTRERHQRNALARGLAGARPDDGVIVSDVDEIPSRAAIRAWSYQMGARGFEQLFCYYWLNCVGGQWAGSRILPYRTFSAYRAANDIRQTDFLLMPDGGWHFSFVGGPSQIVSKLEAYSHQDLNRAQFKDGAYLDQITSLGIDLFGRDMRFRFCPLDGRFPSAVLDNKLKFAHLVREAMFHEDWYPDDQLLRLTDTYSQVRHLAGAILDIGCWEGKSTIALANACGSERVVAVDTWAGYVDESPTHITVRLAAERDVYAQFQTNVQLLAEFLEKCDLIKFAHIDGSHDYDSMKRTIAGCLRWLVPGGVVCGDDLLSAGLERADLAGGVERAVRELLPGFEQTHNFWSWRRPAGA